MLQARKGSSSSKLTKNSQLTTRQANNKLKQRLSQVKSTYRHLRGILSVVQIPAQKSEEGRQHNFCIREKRVI